MAARLSYFLWSSLPDAELSALAASGRLADPDVRAAQVERLLADPRAAAFVEGFAGQWLDLEDIDFTAPDPELHPEFDELLQLSMVRETESFFRDVLDRDLGVLTFVESDFTFLNERLAAHYGIEGVTGQAMRRVALPPDSRRGGLLTQAAILKVTANGTYTSPVVRGAWVLDKILGSPTPPPPDDVGSVEPDTRGAVTIREQLARHRADPSCAACHRKIDPPGFALEEFDPIGGRRSRYRTMSEDAPRPDIRQAPFTHAWVRYRLGPPVDTTGESPDGEPFSDIREFKRILARDPDALARNLTRKLLTYALGRRIGFADRPEVERIVRQSRASDHGFRSLVHAVVRSDLFHLP